MSDNNADAVGLLELLTHDDIEYTVFDGDDNHSYDSLGEALDTALEDADLEVGFKEDVGGATRPVYLSMQGVLETLIERADE